MVNSTLRRCVWIQLHHLVATNLGQFNGNFSVPHLGIIKGSTRWGCQNWMGVCTDTKRVPVKMSSIRGGELEPTAATHKPGPVWKSGLEAFHHVTSEKEHQGCTSLSWLHFNFRGLEFIWNPKLFALTGTHLGPSLACPVPLPGFCEVVSPRAGEDTGKRAEEWPGKAGLARCPICSSLCGAGRPAWEPFLPPLIRPLLWGMALCRMHSQRNKSVIINDSPLSSKTTASFRSCFSVGILVSRNLQKKSLPVPRFSLSKEEKKKKNEIPRKPH